MNRAITILLILIGFQIIGAQEQATAEKAAVLPFSTLLTPPEWDGIGPALGEICAAKLSHTGLQILDRRRINSFITDIDFPSTGYFDKTKLRETSGRYGITVVVKGEFLFSMGKCNITGKVIDAESGLIIKTIEKLVPAKGSEIIKVLNDIVSGTASVLNLSQLSEALTAIEKQGSGNIEALTEFGLGFDAHMGISDSIDYRKAYKHYSAALREDTDFDLARSYRALIAPELGEDLPEIEERETPQPEIDSLDFSEALPAEKEIMELPADSATQKDSTDTLEHDIAGPVQQKPVSEEDTVEYEIVRTYYSDGTLKEEARYKDDERDGLTRHFYPGGSLKAEIYYQADIPDSVCRLYYENGATMSKVLYVKGRREGISRTYYPDSAPRSIIPFRRGKPHGETEHYYKNGEIKQKATYENGKLVGNSFLYYESGKPKARLSYHNNKPDGVSRLFYDNGQLKSETFHTKGIREGPTTIYYANGLAEKIEMYHNGEIDGKVKGFYPNGELEYIYNYKDGVRHGPCTEYYENGSLKSRTKYRKGEIAGKQISWYPKGEIKEKIKRNRDGKETEVITYYENGEPKLEMNFRKGKKEGTHLRYYSNGKVQAKLHYNNDKLKGVQKYYTKDGR
ncbi:MAG: hypothetical protein GF401_14280, partial [Chitinivibrionales bacterium]|nr:hypothetical protein [Chitinivibrionales bacterium]